MANIDYVFECPNNGDNGLITAKGAVHFTTSVQVFTEPDGKTDIYLYI